MNKIKLFLADDHPILRDGIKILLESEKNIEVVGEANDGNEVLEKLLTLDVDVLLLDIDMPESRGLDIIKKLSDDFPKTNVLVFTMHENDHYVKQMMRGGAKGYILKSSRKEILIQAIKAVAIGNTYLCNKIANKIFNGLKINRNQKSDSDTPLTIREIDVLKLVAKGFSNSNIAEQLIISSNTVSTHRKNIMQKLNLHNAAALTNYAASKNLLS